jgi:hypothetical protein
VNSKCPLEAATLDAGMDCHASLAVTQWKGLPRFARSDSQKFLHVLARG